MPQYDYKCIKKGCEHEFEEFNSIERYREPSQCPKCNSKSKRIIKLRQTGPKFTDRLYPFYHDGLGETVTSEKQLEKRCKELGYISKHQQAHMTQKQERYLLEQRKKARF